MTVPFTTQSLQDALTAKLALNFGTEPGEATDQEMLKACALVLRDVMALRGVQTAKETKKEQKKQVHYLSLEFLMGRSLMKNAYNLGVLPELKEALGNLGFKSGDLFELEPDAGLGNGGLGRLAACFLDSLATLNLPGDGVGLRYHFGLFHQSFEDGVQNEKPDPWLTAHSWAEKTDITYPVELAGKEYTARLYKLAVTGYEGRTNTLNLFDLDTIDESIVHDGIAFDKTAIDKNLTLFLYPDDSDRPRPPLPREGSGSTSSMSDRRFPAAASASRASSYRPRLMRLLDSSLPMRNSALI